jgi:phosphoribosylformylglycinamidine cyclo-ligase
VIKKVLDDHRGEVHGIIHNTGGAHTKVLRFAHGLKVIKDNLLPIPPLFQMIQKESETDLKEMFQVFNMGTRLEFYVPAGIADNIVEISNSFNIDAQIIGRVEKADEAEVVVESMGKSFSYTL